QPSTVSRQHTGRRRHLVELAHDAAMLRVGSMPLVDLSRFVDRRVDLIRFVAGQLTMFVARLFGDLASCAEQFVAPLNRPIRIRHCAPSFERKNTASSVSLLGGRAYPAWST